MDHGAPAVETPVLILDGGLGTTLSAAPYNTTYNEKTPLWSSHLLLSSPDTLVSVHREFAAAGADIILTATYQASVEGFSRTPRLDSDSGAGYDQDEAAKYMRSAVNLVSQAISSTDNKHGCAVALSLGAYGAVLSPSQEFSGKYPADMSTEAALASWHRDRMDIFHSEAAAWNQIEYIAFETVRPIAEIRAIRRAVYGIEKRWWISHVVPDSVQTSDLPAVVAAMLVPEDGLAVPWGIGVNCTAIGKIAEIESLYREQVRERFPGMVGRLWLVVYPDGTRGEVYDTVRMEWVKSDRGEHERPWLDLIVDVVRDAKASMVWKGIVVGGCCKTTPGDIKQLRTRIDVLK